MLITAKHIPLTGAAVLEVEVVVILTGGVIEHRFVGMSDTDFPHAVWIISVAGLSKI